MIIQQNIPSLNINNRLTQHKKKADSILEKLSSGYKINRAGDDAAGLAISEKMRGQIRGLNMAGKNIQDGISLIQTAEGALNEVHSLLQRGRELAVQAANDTNTLEDRDTIQSELEQIKEEINRISNDTEFNTLKILNGGSNNLVEGIISKQILLQTSSDEQIMIYTYPADTNITDGSRLGFGITSDLPGGGGGSINLDFSPNPVYDKVILGKDLNETLDNILTTFNDIKNGGPLSTPNKLKLINDYNIRMERKGNNILLYSKTNVRYTVSNPPAYSSFLVNPNQEHTITVEEKGLVASPTLSIHLGANSDQNMKIDLPNLSINTLGLETINLSTQNEASTAITSFDNAITFVSKERSKLGAYENRLEHIYNSVTNTSENLQSAESRIRDTDMAKEMMTFTKNNILLQATQSMLAQSNKQPEGILQLLQ